MNSIKGVRISTMYRGLVPIEAFDAVEIENMIDDPDLAGGLIPRSDYDEQPPAAFSVRLHYRSGGVETIQDHRFDAADPSSVSAAETSTVNQALSLSDLLLASDPDLTLVHVLGESLSKHPHATSQDGTEAQHTKQLVMDPEKLAVGDLVAASPVGSGCITDFSERGFPKVNGIAVVWLRRSDGAEYDPWCKAPAKGRSTTTSLLQPG